VKIEKFQTKPWVGVDLDGTLAHWEDGYGAGDTPIGQAVEPMLARVRAWLAVGLTVKIFTARAAEKDQIPVVREWLRQHGLHELEITNAKDCDMVEMWDDRAVTVVRNTGVGIRPIF
jgi:hypothetical protein